MLSRGFQIYSSLSRDTAQPAASYWNGAYLVSRSASLRRKKHYRTFNFQSARSCGLMSTTNAPEGVVPQACASSSIAHCATEGEAGQGSAAPSLLKHCSLSAPATPKYSYKPVNGDRDAYQRIGVLRHSQSQYLSTSSQDDSNTQRPNRVFVMLPLDTVNHEGVFRYATASWFSQALHLLAASGVHGVAVDVWWGAVEREPRHYHWSGYKQLAHMVKATGLKLQVVLGFHGCGGNAGDTVEIPLPKWVLQAGEHDPDLFFTDRPRGSGSGQRDREYISLWADDAPGVLCGRSPMQCYEEFMVAFRSAFVEELGPLIEEVAVGAGPSGELRYPSYLEAHGWRFPGVGEFQCYDRRALASLAEAATAAGHPEWGYTGPHNSGVYSSRPTETEFFQEHGSWDSPYGRFFLKWYSDCLVQHGDRILSVASQVFASRASPRPGPEKRDSNSDNSEELFLKPLRNESCDSFALCSSYANLTATSNPRSRHQSHSQVQAEADYEVDRSENSITCSMDVTPASDSKTPLVKFVCSNSQLNGESSEQHGPARMQVCNSTSSLSTECNVTPYANLEPVQDLDYSDAAGTSTPDDTDYLFIPRTGGYDAYYNNRALEVAGSSGQQPSVSLTLKIPGIHWWYRSRSHAAELTAGYYNAEGHDGYHKIVELCAKYKVMLNLTCVEMSDVQHPGNALCGPEGLLRQIRMLAARSNVSLGGENALPIFYPDGFVDHFALDRIIQNTRAWTSTRSVASACSLNTIAMGNIVSTAGHFSEVKLASESKDQETWKNEVMELPALRTFTFLRLGPELLQPSYQVPWMRFMYKMTTGCQI